ncbi:outer membrane protein%2C OMP85 family [Neisseria meningitidis]|nr:outer membrane protein%2C OMP85 family [Neisseria meningitidis]
MHDTRTMMIKPTALLLPALFFFPHAYAPAADLSENKAAGFALFKNKSPDTESVKLKPKFPVRIDTQDSEIKDMVEEHLPLITQQQEEVLDKEQTGFLAEEAPDNVKTMLRSKGYFSSKVSLTEKDGAYTVHITPGPRTKIANVGVAILGDILSDGNLAEYYRNALENWQQPVGSDFDQDSWENSKTSVLGAVTRKAYPLAKLGNTRAAVNPDTATADLNVVVDSGRPIAFGDFEITGTQRYPEQIVSGLARFQPGTPYDLDLLLDFQQALEQNGHYSGASVQADFDRLQGDRVPVKVSVTKVKRHKLETGIRLDSEYGLGGKIAYDYYNLFNKGYIGSSSGIWTNTKPRLPPASASRATIGATTGQATFPTTVRPPKTSKNAPSPAASGMCATARASMPGWGQSFSQKAGKSPARISIWATATPRC